MARYQKFIPVDVLTEARRRIHHIYDIFDSVVVSFSGGKDSLVVLHLVKEVAEERGEGPFRVVFRDEELIHPSVASFIETYRGLPWCDLQWWTVPLDSSCYVLGEVQPLIQWDPARGPDNWARPRPEWGMTEADLGLAPGTVLDQKHADLVAAQGLPGKVAILTGVRAAESLIRYRACVNKLVENYLVASSDKRVQLGRPIFDWQENDVFRYFYDQGIDYCPIYDSQVWGGRSMRVSSALPPEASKIMNTLKATDPELYEMCARVFPHVEVQARYATDLATGSAGITAMANSWDDITAWVRANIADPKQRVKALNEVRGCRGRAAGSPEAYPLDYVLHEIVKNSGDRVVMPLGVKRRAEYERAAARRRETTDA